MILLLIKLWLTLTYQWALRSVLQASSKESLGQLSTAKAWETGVPEPHPERVIWGSLGSTGQS